MLFWNFDATFRLCFNLVAVFKSDFLLFRQVLKICRHLMLNPSWDASHMTQHLKFEKMSPVGTRNVSKYGLFSLFSQKMGASK
jgi:hypothetical protein